MQPTAVLTRLIPLDRRAPESPRQPDPPPAPREDFQSYLRTLNDQPGRARSEPAPESPQSSGDRPSTESESTGPQGTAVGPGKKNRLVTNKPEVDTARDTDKPVDTSPQPEAAAPKPEPEPTSAPATIPVAPVASPSNATPFSVQIPAPTAGAIAPASTQAAPAASPPLAPTAAAPDGSSATDGSSNEAPAVIRWHSQDPAANAAAANKPAPPAPRLPPPNEKAFDADSGPDRGPRQTSPEAVEQGKAGLNQGSSKQPPSSASTWSTDQQSAPHTSIKPNSEPVPNAAAPAHAPDKAGVREPAAIPAESPAARALDSPDARAPREGATAPARRPFSGTRRPDANALALTTIRHTSTGEDAEQAEALRVVTVRGGSGDGAAAALGRFLVTDSTASRGSDSAAHRSIASPGEVKSALIGGGALGGAGEAAGLARPGDTVADILATAVTRGDSIEGASKLLSSGGASGRHQVVLQLDPPELGQLRMEIRMNQASMALRVNVENASVAHLVESRLPELKDALATHGIRVDQAEVHIRTADPQAAGGRQDEARSGQDSSHQGFTQDSGRWSGGGSSHASGGDTSAGDRAMDWQGSLSDERGAHVAALGRESVLTRTAVDVTA